jgi:hypothetical protein
MLDSKRTTWPSRLEQGESHVRYPHLLGDFERSPFSMKSTPTANRWLASVPRSKNLKIWLVNLGIGVACLGCGPGDQERERRKEAILREIEGGDARPLRKAEPTAIEPSWKKAAPVTTDRVEIPWVSEESLPLDDWEIQYLGNEPVGFFHRRIERSAGQEQGTLRLSAKSQTRLRGREKEVEQKFDLIAFERLNGMVIRFEGSFEVGARYHRFDGAVRDDALSFYTNLFGRGDSIRIAWTESDRGPFAIEQSLMRSPMREGEKRRLRYFEPLLGRPVDVQLTAFDYFDTPTFEGTKENLLEIEITPPIEEDPSSTRIWVDRKGRIHKRYEPSLDLKSFRCTRESAMLVADRSELANLTLRPIKVFSIPLGTEVNQPVRYEVESIDPDFSLSIPSRTQQIVQTIKSRKLQVTVYPASQLTQPIEGLDTEASPPEEYLVSSPLIQSNHPEVRKLADALLMADEVSPDDSPARRALALARGIASRIENIPFDRRVSSATQTLSAGKGDSFDVAALLAGICRSQGIPARIAIGLRGALVAQAMTMNLHAWTEIHDGTRWTPLDASLPHPETAADRIKWLDSTWNTVNPYESILQIAKHLSVLEVSVMRGGR